MQALAVLVSLFTFLIYQWLDILEKIYDRTPFSGVNALAILITFMFVFGFVYSIYEALKEMHEKGGILESMIDYVDLTIKAYTYKKDESKLIFSDICKELEPITVGNIDN